MKPAKASRSALVIGGGVVGLFTAWRLMDAAFGVTVIDRDRVGGSASWAGGGILCPLPPWQAPAAVWALALESMRAYAGITEHLRDATGIDPELISSGMRVLDAPDSEAAVQWAASAGMKVQELDSALHLPWVAQLRSPRLLKALKAYLTQRGVHWLEEAEVKDFKTQADRVLSVEVNHGTSHRADLMVLCAGAWSGQLGNALGQTLPVQPVRGQMLLFDAPKGLLNEIVLCGEYYLIPRQDGPILVGSTLEWTGFDASTTASAQRQLAEAACRLLPALQHCKVSQHWAALRPGSEQGIPIIERAQHFSNLFLNTGHFRNGITLAPASAERVVSLVLS